MPPPLTTLNVWYFFLVGPTNCPRVNSLPQTFLTLPLSSLSLKIWSKASLALFSSALSFLSLTLPLFLSPSNFPRSSSLSAPPSSFQDTSPQPPKLLVVLPSLAISSLLAFTYPPTTIYSLIVYHNVDGEEDEKPTSPSSSCNKKDEEATAKWQRAWLWQRATSASSFPFCFVLVFCP